MNRREFVIGSTGVVMLSACGSGQFSADMVTQVDSEFPFKLFRVPGEHALDAHDLLSRRIAGSESAVVLGPREELEYLGDETFRSSFGTPESILEKASTHEFPAGFRAHLRSQMDKLREQYKDDPAWQSLFGDSFEFGLAEDMPAGDWPSESLTAADIGGFTLHIDWQTGQPHKEVMLGVFPTADWTEIPAYLPFGGWNECPLPEWHVAALRYWRDKWGARLIGMSHDVLELRVEKRPQTRDAALELAREQYDYCADIVDQGVGDIATLAQYLMATDLWYFWWD